MAQVVEMESVICSWQTEHRRGTRGAVLGLVNARCSFVLFLNEREKHKIGLSVTV